MSDNVSKAEIDARFDALDARTDVKFERLLGEIRVSNAELAGKLDVVAAKAAGRWTVWGAALTVGGVMLATTLGVLAFGGDRFDGGLNAASIADQAAAKAISNLQR
ncbi:hypothetical protein MU852_04150 [Brevundimonas albigilva]|uniref:hypothetical protein n=1 Tax=Brevundimonas albigilva TaxID=1312364 RepID=UPI00201B8ED5|nr:hypothetical protein [Brevundimonas albigilva]UQV19063.1 hypothetical protein MU852_04150 [Brevundimonas albigilva]